MATANFPQIFQPFFRQFSGTRLNRAIYDPQYSTQDSITAVGSTQSAGPVLVAQSSHITVCATGNGVQLPLAVVGMERNIRNDGAQTLKIYGNSAGTDTIGGTAGATGVTLAAAANVSYRVISAGKWIAN